jgi:hypothetical protein
MSPETGNWKPSTSSPPNRTRSSPACGVPHRNEGPQQEQNPIPESAVGAGVPASFSVSLGANPFARKRAPTAESPFPSLARSFARKRAPTPERKEAGQPKPDPAPCVGAGMPAKFRSCQPFARKRAPTADSPFSSLARSFARKRAPTSERKEAGQPKPRSSSLCGSRHAGEVSVLSALRPQAGSHSRIPILQPSSLIRPQAGSQT